MIACAVLVGGCNDGNPVSAPGVVLVLTNASEYPLAGGQVASILLNDTNRTVYTLSCTDHVTLEVQEAGGWKNLGAWYPMCDGPTIPIPLEPGTFRSLPALDAATVASLGPGTYRLRVDVYSNNTFPYELLPEDQRISEPFRIVDIVK